MIMGSKQEKLEQLTHEGAKLYQSGRIKEAEECYRQAIKVDKKEPIAWGMLGLVLNAQERREESLKAFQECFKLTKEPHPAILLNYSGLLKSMDRVEEAEKVLLQILRDYPQFFAAWFNLGNLYLQRKDWKQAEEKYEVALNHSPDPETTVGILWNRGVALKELRELDRAEKSLLDALEIDPSNTGVKSVLEEVRTIKSERLMREIEYESRLRSIQFVRKDKDGKEERTGLSDDVVKYARQHYLETQTKIEEGYKLWSDGRLDDALVVATELSRKSGSLPQIQMLIATIMVGKGEFSTALSISEAVLKNYPNSTEAWLRKGEALAGLGKMQEAEESMQKAIATSPNDERVKVYIDNWRKKSK
jgi:tetratricopeptide (TPR) repeat protein